MDMNNVFDMKDFIGTSQGDKEHMLGNSSISP